MLASRGDVRNSSEDREWSPALQGHEAPSADHPASRGGRAGCASRVRLRGRSSSSVDALPAMLYSDHRRHASGRRVGSLSMQTSGETST
jgi:hypothetical protein